MAPTKTTIGRSNTTSLRDIQEPPRERQTRDDSITTYTNVKQALGEGLCPIGTHLVGLSFARFSPSKSVGYL